jgi:hypothetical protein
VSSWRTVRGIGTGRFAALVLGGAAASAVWILTVMFTATTPQQARAEHSSPKLPPPTAKVESRILRQYTWHDCNRDVNTVDVLAPSSPPGSLPLVTAIARPGKPVRTGIELARVAGQPVIALVTNQVLYRDLVVGAAGPDVRGFERAMMRAGVISRAGRFLDVASIGAWNRSFDHTGVPDRIRVSTLLAVPAGGHVAGVFVKRGSEATRGSRLMEVQAGSDRFTCHGIARDSDLTLRFLQLQVNGEQLPVIDATVEHKGQDPYADVDVRPATAVDAETARLGVQHATSDGPVLAVPLSAVLVSEEGTTSVVVIHGNSHKRIPVGLGVSSQGLVGVRGVGLKVGDQVQLFDPARTSAAIDKLDGPDARVSDGN